MKRVRNLLSLLMIIFLLSANFNAYGANTVKAVAALKAPAVSQNVNQALALDRAESLGAIDRGGSGFEAIIKRGEFAKAVVIAAGLSDTADSLKYQSNFSDVDINNGLSGYINTAINKGFLTGMADGKFHPEQGVTLAQAVTAAVRALGYSDSSLSGVWPNNYIQKSKTLKLLDGINLNANDALTRGAAAVIIDRLLNTNIKKINPQDTDKTLATAGGYFTDCVVLGNSSTDPNLDENQILTDQGVYSMGNTSVKLEIGNKYRMLLDNDSVSNVFYSLKNTKRIVVNSVKGTAITYQDNNKSLSMTLSNKLVYYYKGVKQTYDNIKNVIQGESTIVYANKDDNTGYEYAVILDPVYSSPVIVNLKNVNDKNIGAIDIAPGEKITKDGEYIDVSSIDDQDVAYEVTDISNTSKYIAIYDQKVEGKLTNILPNRLYPTSIQIDNKNYDISKDMDISKITNDSSSYKVSSTVQILLGYDGKVVDIAKDAVVGTNGDYIVLGNSKTDPTLSSNQILTDKGVKYFGVNDLNLNLNLGGSYTLYADNDRILKNVQALNNIKNIVVNNIIGSTVTYTDNGNEFKLNLPDNITYYYQGVKQNYSNLSNIIQTDTTIIFGINNNNGYDYAVIVDPVYSKPEIASNIKQGDKNIGSISLSDKSLVVENGVYINPYSIENGAAVYRISDIQNTTSYILAVDNKITGSLTAILPNKLNPNTIQIDNKNYIISKDMDIKKVTNKNGSFNIGDIVHITLGYDGKIIDMDYTEGQDNGNYAYVLNASSSVSFGNTVYNVKLLKSDGTIVTYTTNTDSSSLKGTMVIIGKVDNQVVQLTTPPNLNIAYGDTIINKEDKKIGEYFASDNVRVFDVISNNAGEDAVVKVLNWDDLHSGVLQAGRISFMNHTGDFGDINVMVLNDVFDEGYSYGFVKSMSMSSISKTRVSFNYTIGIGGKDYQWSTTNIYSIPAQSVVSVSVQNGQVTNFGGIVTNEPAATNIQAIDTNKIKLNNIVYKFRNGIAVYYKDSTGNITTKNTTDIDITKTYSNISIYLDKPLSYGGKVKMIVISE